jgi:protein TonB
MPSLKTILPKAERALVADSPKDGADDRRQRKLMAGSLCLLLLALGIVLWHDRDFWFSDAREAQSEQPVVSSPVAKAVLPRELAPVAAPAAKLSHRAPLKTHPEVAKESVTSAPETPAPPVVTTRTVLPPLDVEVVAGDTRRTLRPGSSPVRVDLQPDTPPQTASDAGATADSDTTARVTSDAAERVQMSTDASEIITSPVKPNYPLLARQMKVQGSVILQALIGRDGVIQNLRVVSGPHILAAAAEDAVRQWHFKPHFQGAEAVETQAKITVNFTISTN